jgi:hypothetical protein
MARAERRDCLGALPRRWGAGTSPGSSAQGGGGTAARCPCERGCPDRSADRYADRPPCLPAHARACGIGRRGGSASAVCLMAEPWTMVAWACGPRDRTTLPPQRRARWSVDTVVAVTPQAPVHVSRCCPHALGKTGHREGRMAAVQGTSASCLLGKQWAETGAGRARKSSAGAEPSCARAAP